MLHSATETPGDTDAEMFDVDALANLLKCSPRHIYRLCDSGKMPAPLKLGALCRWPKMRILTWIADGCPAVRNVPAKPAARS